MKVAVLGANDVTPVVLDAILSRGEHEAFLVIPWAPGQTGVRIEPSPLNELSFGYPGVEEIPIDCNVIGGNIWRAVRKDLHRAGLYGFTGTLPRTSDYRIFEHTKHLLGEVPNIMWAPEVETLHEILEREIGDADLIINVLDRSQLCGGEDHSFMVTRVWWSTTKGPSPSENNVVFNTGDAPAWAIASKIDDRKVTIWDHEPPFDDIWTHDLPTRMVCNCDSSGIDMHVGRWATYKPITLAGAYEQVVEFLHHPLARINDETLEMEAIDGDQPPGDT